MTPKIDILLASYNGEDFIAEQIDAVLAQTYQDFRLIIRDDGSSDSTPAIIEDYARRYPAKIVIVHDDVVCRNPTKNFMELVKHAKADYVMFCDQDDVWLPYKVRITLDYMEAAELANPDKPVLVFTGLHEVDRHLVSMDKYRNLGLSRERYSLKSLLVCNCISGCTEMVNRKLYSRLGEYDDRIEFHDWWTALYASATGVICHVPMALIDYRQHGNNVTFVQEAPHFRKIRIISSIVFSPLKKYAYSRKKFRLQGGMYILLKERFSQEILPENQKYIDDYIALFGRSRLKRLGAYIRSDYRKVYGLFENVMFVLKLLFL